MTGFVVLGHKWFLLLGYNLQTEAHLHIRKENHALVNHNYDFGNS